MKSETNPQAKMKTHYCAGCLENHETQLPTAGDFGTLRTALFNTSRINYENVRENLICKIGYDAFRTMQTHVFGEIQSILDRN